MSGASRCSFGARVRAAAVGVGAALCAAAPAGASVWTFASDGPLLLGGSVSGYFSGVDTDADQFLQASELTGFSASYFGVPPNTQSFSIDKLMLEVGDRFLFDLTSGDFSFGVVDALNQSISGGSQEFTSVVGLNGADAGGTLLVTSVPEPGTLPLVLGSLALAVTVLRRRGPGAAAA